jgi:IS30 family transposase
MKVGVAVPHGVEISREVRRGFWAGLRAGLSPSEAAAGIGASESAGRKWIIKAGGVMERRSMPGDLRLSLAERETIGLMCAAGFTFTAIGQVLGRPTSTVSREVGGISGRERYRPLSAHRGAEQRARRPKQTKLEASARLRERVEEDLEQHYSPEQIAGRLRRDFPEDPEMQVHHETIYRELFVQGRGALRKELYACLRSGRARRVTRRSGREDRRGQIPAMVMIADRPEEVDQRVVPGHWEGDLITGTNNASAIGTLVERVTGFTVLLYLPDSHGAQAVTAAIAEAMAELPKKLRQTLTWDQGKEMAGHKEVAEATELAIYFCDPHSPWQRPVNENTNGLLRQYFPKGTDLSVHTRADLAWVAHQLNDRPRKRLEYARPSELINDLLLR